MIEMNLLNQTALVTGAGRGIGKAISLALAEAGAHVILTARSTGEIKDVAEEITAGGGSAEAVTADLSAEADILQLFDHIRKTRSQLDILINNAGYGIFGSTADFDTDDLDTVLSVNLRGTFLCCREALKLMLSADSGYIINISSVVGIKGYANQAAYTSVKHGIMGLTKSIAAETQDSSIRVSVILPGGTDTEMVRQARPDLDYDELMQPQDIAQAVSYLLSLSDRAAVDELYIRRRNSKPF